MNIIRQWQHTHFALISMSPSYERKYSCSNRYTTPSARLYNRFSQSAHWQHKKEDLVQKHSIWDASHKKYLCVRTIFLHQYRYKRRSTSALCVFPALDFWYLFIWTLRSPTISQKIAGVDDWKNYTHGQKCGCMVRSSCAPEWLPVHTVYANIGWWYWRSVMRIDWFCLASSSSLVACCSSKPILTML